MIDREVSGEATALPSDRYELTEPTDCPEWSIEELAAADGVIAECLGSLSGEWQQLCANDLTSDEYYIHERLTAAGLTERRLSVEARRRADEPVQVTCIASGDYSNHLPIRIARDVPRWLDEHGKPVGIICLDINRRQEVRLTGQGLLAQSELRSGDSILAGHVKGFVRGFTPFSNGHLAEGVVRIESQTIPAKIADAEPAAPARMTWHDAAERMERLRLASEEFTSQPLLAKQFVCSPATISKAIHSTPSLQAWAGVNANSAAPKAQSINKVVTDSTAQGRELGPEDEVSIREYLERDDITRDEKAFFLAKSPADQVAFLNLLADDPDANPNAVDPVTKGKGRLHERILNRKP